MKNGLKKDSGGIATLVIVIIVAIIIIGAGVGAYLVLSGNNDSKNGDGNGNVDVPALGGPGLKSGESLTYTVSGNAIITDGGTTMTFDNVLSGTITLAYKQEPNGEYTVTVSVDLSYDLFGAKDRIVESQSVMVAEKDMAKFGIDARDLSDLKELGYTDADIQKIQQLLGNFTTATETLSTVDGNITVEKWTYELKWNDIKNLMPTGTGTFFDDVPLKALDIKALLWFGKDVLYKTTYDLDINIEESGQSLSVKVSGSLTLTEHKKV